MKDYFIRIFQCDNNMYKKIFSLNTKHVYFYNYYSIWGEIIFNIDELTVFYIIKKLFLILEFYTLYFVSYLRYK